MGRLGECGGGSDNTEDSETDHSSRDLSSHCGDCSLPGHFVAVTRLGNADRGLRCRTPLVAGTEDGLEVDLGSADEVRPFPNTRKLRTFQIRM